MKTLLAAIIGVIAVGATLPAVAGPDWQIIEHGRKAKLERMQPAGAAAQAAAPESLAAQPAQKMAPNSDHEKMVKACAEDDEARAAERKRQVK